jgi:hypothetical protein
MDKQGIRKTEEERGTAKVYAAEYLSLIRPLFRRLAESARNLTWGLERLGIDKIWQNGLYGKGIRVGYLDTGVDASNEALRGQVKAFVDIDYDGNIIQIVAHPEMQHMIVMNMGLIQQVQFVEVWQTACHPYF